MSAITRVWVEKKNAHAISRAIEAQDDGLDSAFESFQREIEAWRAFLALDDAAREVCDQSLSPEDVYTRLGALRAALLDREAAP